MSYFFCANYDATYRPLCNTAAASFDDDISAWDTSGVTKMGMMFWEASAFNQDLSGWAVHSITEMWGMFHGASAFNQTLGWCVADDVVLADDVVDDGWGSAFYGTKCESTSCGVRQSCMPSFAPTTSHAPTVTAAPTVTPLVADDSNIHTAVAAWLSNPTAAEATYGHIRRWDTSGVTNMTLLFCGAAAPPKDYRCNDGANHFNDDISAWDTSAVTNMFGMFTAAQVFNQPIGGWNVSKVTDMTKTFDRALAFNQTLADWRVDKVTRMYQMFVEASSFNHPLSDWSVDKVTTMYEMFKGASSFNQTLGWCVANGVTVTDMFATGRYGPAPPCGPTTCGVTFDCP